MLKDVSVENKEGIAILTLNRPDVLNAFSYEMRESLAIAFEDFAKNDEVRAVVITGAGRAFSAGGDIKGWADLIPLVSFSYYLSN